MERPDFFELKNGEKVKLPFTDKEYNDRVSKLRSVMDKNNLDMVILTSMHTLHIIQVLFTVLLADHTDVSSPKIKFQQFQLILMQVNHGVDHIVIMLFILIGKETIF